jgi:hypothetical protein
MSERSVQLNIRTAKTVAEALRAEALRRDIALGEVLEQLLVRARASTQAGVWLSLSSEVESALEAVAAARTIEPSQLLRQLVAGEVRRALLELADGLTGPAGEFGDDGRGRVSGVVVAPLESSSGLVEIEPSQSSRRNPAHGLPSLGDDPDDDEVGIFTVFE